MESKIANAISLKNHPVALLWSDDAPEGALQFKPGKWGCVMSLIAGVAAKGRTSVADRQTYGCWGGGVGLGFGNTYETFPGGLEGFYRFLSDGNEKTEVGRQIGAGMEKAGVSLADDFLHGERYVKDPACTQTFVQSMPMREVPTKYVVLKPLEETNPAQDNVKSVTFFVEPDALSALVILANHAHPERENVGMPWAAGCQVIGIYGYQELEREYPRALVGLTDISARHTTRAILGKNVMSFTVPWPLFLEMEKYVDGSFFERETWKALQG